MSYEQSIISQLKSSGVCDEEAELIAQSFIAVGNNAYHRN